MKKCLFFVFVCIEIPRKSLTTPLKQTAKLWHVRSDVFAEWWFVVEIDTSAGSMQFLFLVNRIATTVTPTMQRPGDYSDDEQQQQQTGK